jgi:hypothetical protein
VRVGIICAKLQLAMNFVANAFGGSADPLIAAADGLTSHELKEHAADEGLGRVGRGGGPPCALGLMGWISSAAISGSLKMNVQPEVIQLANFFDTRSAGPNFSW